MKLSNTPKSIEGKNKEKMPDFLNLERIKKSALSKVVKLLTLGSLAFTGCSYKIQPGISSGFNDNDPSKTEKKIDDNNSISKSVILEKHNLKIPNDDDKVIDLTGSGINFIKPDIIKNNSANKETDKEDDYNDNSLEVKNINNSNGELFIENNNDVDIYSTSFEIENLHGLNFKSLIEPFVLKIESNFSKTTKKVSAPMEFGGKKFKAEVLNEGFIDEFKNFIENKLTEEFLGDIKAYDIFGLGDQEILEKEYFGTNSVDHVYVNGMSSPETAKQGSEKIGKYEKENIKLAKERGKIFLNILNKYALNSDNVTFSYEEVQNSIGETIELKKIADKLSGGNITDLLKKFNNGEFRSDKINEKIGNILNSKRMVDIVLDYENDGKNVISIPLPIFILAMLGLLPGVLRKIKKNKKNNSSDYYGKGGGRYGKKDDNNDKNKYGKEDDNNNKNKYEEEFYQEKSSYVENFENKDGENNGKNDFDGKSKNFKKEVQDYQEAKKINDNPEEKLAKKNKLYDEKIFLEDKNDVNFKTPKGKELFLEIQNDINSFKNPNLSIEGNNLRLFEAAKDVFIKKIDRNIQPINDKIFILKNNIENFERSDNEKKVLELEDEIHFLEDEKNDFQKIKEYILNFNL